MFVIDNVRLCYYNKEKVLSSNTWKKVNIKKKKKVKNLINDDFESSSSDNG